ncbi:TPA: decarboxylating 6-phosphogluconate dehydrogenase [Candidatus Taylorbacteria bacterium]|nr:decarboxylating 6-phosphogluconate dehydrogenase [Candidatus Taylorbacteria bacterium]
MKPQIAIFGLGRMGGQIARRLHKNNFTVFAWNRGEEHVKEIKQAGIAASQNIDDVVKHFTAKQRIFWIMLPHAVVDDFLFGGSKGKSTIEGGGLAPHLKKGDIVIDGGNSFYKESIERSKKLAKIGVTFFDCGTSGGVWGERNGFALMVGGPKLAWKKIEPVMQTLSAGDNYALLGEAGAGHFAKMVHNGMEYGMMEAIAEGYGVLEASKYKYNLKDVTRVYQKGSVVRSWLIDLCRNIFETENFKKVSGKIDSNGEAEWTIKTAKELKVDVRVIADALKVRNESASSKNQKKFSNKMVALMRKQFGGHEVHKK